MSELAQSVQDKAALRRLGLVILGMCGITLAIISAVIIVSSSVG